MSMPVNPPTPQPLSPEQRLAQTRSALRRAVGQDEAAGERHPHGGHGEERDTMTHTMGLMIQRWLDRHPWTWAVRTAGAVAMPVSREVVQRNPFLALGGALATGALFAWLRPWRLLSGTLLIGTLVQLLRNGPPLTQTVQAHHLIRHMVRQRRRGSTSPQSSARD